MKPEELDARESALAALAREAGELAKRHFLERDRLAVTMKGAQDYLTAADGAVERFIVQKLNLEFPHDAVLGEEGGRHGSGDALWVIDPIDGTENFAHGIGHFCVSIAFATGRTVQLGALAAPMYGELYLARRGRGATLNGRPMRTSTTATMARAVIELGWSARRPIAAYTSLVERVIGAGATFRRVGSGALGLAYVADGRTEGYCELHINSWDALAGILLVEEAGGWVNDFLAGEGMMQGNEIIAATPQLREALVAATGIGKGSMGGKVKTPGRRKK